MSAENDSDGPPKNAPRTSDDFSDIRAKLAALRAKFRANLEASSTAAKALEDAETAFARAQSEVKRAEDERGRREAKPSKPSRPGNR